MFIEFHNYYKYYNRYWLTPRVFLGYRYVLAI